eukprot:CAMPEP_0204213938 /NCGR_PEP_ID=MMETSP0361-20130328/76362_1 /ASSEMBLY_ACC=CAM_ASM_000343 /TAXON_ID=268821 /ORGANISM="Scrippsiella Hangoei, Strain SHTV-5" /LENGTH=32 /DNA_ID= /DNA_START= /DNA_END= /DNA_ORIENTATION=
MAPAFLPHSSRQTPPSAELLRRHHVHDFDEAD